MLLGILVLILALYGLLQTEWGQNILAREITKKLSRDLQTKISIKHVKIGLLNFNRMDLEGVLVEDQKKDTLLYAGTFQVRITDWFFFRDKAELKYVGLEDAVVYFNRTDSVWNYQFLEQYFASGGSSGKKKSGIEFDLKKVVLKNVLFKQTDQWVGSNMIVQVGGLDMDARKITITNKTVDVSNLVLNDPYFSTFNYAGLKPASENQVVSAGNEKTAQPWKIFFGNITINNGRYRNDAGSLQSNLSYFDGKHIDFSKINGSLSNIGWTEDTVRGQVDLRAIERSGLTIKSLKARTTIHPQAMIFEDLFLQTNNSTLGDYFSMRYDDIRSMNNFIHDVVMEASFSNARISSDDIAYFAPEVRSWNRNIRIDGDVKGTVDGLSSNDLEVWAGNDTYLKGAVSLVGLPRISETLINVDARELRTTYRDAVSFVPALRNVTTPDLRKLGFLKFRGTYTGFINDFVTYGTLQTNLGTITTDLNMKVPANGSPSYVGSFSTDGFQLGQFVNNSELGLLSFNGRVKGSGFKWTNLNIDVDGSVNRFDYNGYAYRNIKVNGNLSNRLFNGDFAIDDPNAQLTLNGVVDFRKEKPFFNVRSNIGFANLQALGLTPENFLLTGKFDLDMEASSLSDMLGTARIYEASLTSNGKRLSFDSLVVSSFYESGLKRFTAVSNEFQVNIRGDFNLDALPDAFTVFLHRYYPSYIRRPENIAPQIFEFDITTGVVEDYISLIDKRLSGFNNSTIKGSLNTVENSMTVDTDIPHFSFNNYDFSDIRLTGNGDLSRLMLTGEVSNATVGDSLFFPQTAFTIVSANDVSDITLNTSSNQAINQASLSAQVKTFSDGAAIVLNPSTFVLNGKTWNIEEGGELNFRRNTLVQGEVVLRESNQEIRLWTVPDDLGGWNNLMISWNQINLGDISPLFTRAYHFEGMVSGEARIEDPAGRMNVSGEFTASELRIDNDSIGGFRGTIGYDHQTGMFTAKGYNTDPDHRVEVDVAMDFKDSADLFRDRINTRFTNFQLSYLNRFLGTLFSDINGYVTGTFDILGEGGNQDFIAKARVRDASFLVNFTQVKYWVTDTEFEMRKDLIDLNGIRIRDKDGRYGLVSGFIRHNSFRNMYYDIKVETESDRMQLLNTTDRDNEQFYGKAWGGGTFVLVGPQEDMLMDINATASTQDESYIVLPPSETRESGQADFMVERKYGREMTPEAIGITSNLHYNVRIAANPSVTIEVQLDELTRDAIIGKGNGILRIASGTSEPLTINGRYDITEGKYDYTFQSLLKRPFELREGGNNYIVWDGDPYGATVNLEAVYTALDVSFAPLAGNVFGSEYASQRDNVNVVARLTGNLFQPDFSFRLELPSNNPNYSTPEFQLALQQLQNNQNELYKQVTYLIVFNSFAPFENAGSTAGINPFSELTYNTISGLLFSKINEELNKILSGILRTNNATFNFTGSLYNSNIFNANARGEFQLPNQSLVNLGIGLPLFQGRAHFTIGATLDVPLSSSFDQNIRLFPDVTLELMVNKSGSVRATFFYKKNIDFLVGDAPSDNQSRRFGASIGYKKEFDNLSELFNRKKPAVKDTIPKVQDSIPPTDTTGEN